MKLKTEYVEIRLYNNGKLKVLETDEKPKRRIIWLSHDLEKTLPEPYLRLVWKKDNLQKSIVYLINYKLKQLSEYTKLIKRLEKIRDKNLAAWWATGLKQ